MPVYTIQEVYLGFEMHKHKHLGIFERIFFVTQDVSLTGAALLIDALQANGLNNMYGVVGIQLLTLPV